MPSHRAPGAASALVSAFLSLAVASPAGAEDRSPEDLIASALSAGPAGAVRDATVVTADEHGMMTTLRAGSGAFTCMPDAPATPGNDPMCVDANGLKWIEALMRREAPPVGAVGLGYMLQGGSDADNDDPFAAAPPAGKPWVSTGPHLMIFNAPGLMEGHPANADDTTRPYVMYPGTPYAHLMVPVE
jgi:hypothetical protein